MLGQQIMNEMYNRLHKAQEGKPGIWGILEYSKAPMYMKSPWEIPNLSL